MPEDMIELEDILQLYPDNCYIPTEIINKKHKI